MKNTLASARNSRGIWARYRDLSFGIKMLAFMVLGVACGIIFGERAAVVQPVGDLFIRLLIMAAAPLVFFNLLAGITAASDPRILGRLGLRIMSFYVCTTLIALALGLAVIHALKPGVGMPLKGEVSQQFGEVPKIADILLDLVPGNIFQAFANGKITQVVVFGVLLGISVLFLPREQRERLTGIFSLFADAMRKMVGLILGFGPLGVGALSASVVGQYGTKLFGPLSLFVGGVWLAQACMVVVYMVLLYAFTRWSPLDFLKKIGPVCATAAATCSSLASLTVSLEVAEKRLRLPRSIYSFTIPLGSQFNKDGTSIMLSGILLFTAQAAGVHFEWSTILMVLLVGLVLSEGSGGVPGAGLVIAMIFVQAFHLPLEIAVIVGGVYRFFDMSNTVINTMGDLVGTAIVAKFEPPEPAAVDPGQPPRATG